MTLRSLRVSLVLPYVLLLALVAAALGGTFYWAASRNIGLFSDQYMRAIASRIAQAVHFHVRGSASVLEAAFPEGMPVKSDLALQLAELRTRFWVATSMFTNPNNYVYYGNEAGQSIALKRLSEQEAELRLKLRPELHRLYYSYRGVQGKPRLIGQEPGLFDPRERVWYQLARQTSMQVWTTVYIDFSSQDLVVTRARRVLGADGLFQGVVATDVSLQEVNRFVGGLDVGDRGRAFVVERDGKLIAATGAANLGLSVDGKPLRVNAANSDDPVIRAAYQGMARLVGESRADSRLDDNREYRLLVQDDEGDTITVAARRVVDDAGMDWLAIVAIPRTAIFTGIHQQLGIALGIGLLAVLLTILIGTRIFGRIAQEVIALSQAVDRIRSGDPSVAIATRRQDELGDLARNFSAMQRDLFTDRLTGAASRMALDSLLARLTADRRAMSFAVLFIDLNDFKPLNDQFGHDSGDQALLEIAGRIKACLRAEDLLARRSGDEFIVVAMGVSSADALDSLKAKLRIRITAPLETLTNIPPGRVVRLGVAIGAACWPADARDAEALLKQADEAMYRDKPSGRR
ncbi:diguanylate cyclase domain-containing protein [Castellaniella sp.]|uniref:sensor domain-containing diguanylate cyclase n=1 Tax=Castellaniella sp. TaxID=1955812 RepID=UPI002AFEF313|nr:diguanylate cyclase [Castellaniella sp.]